MNELVIGKDYERPTIGGIPVILPGHDDKELPCVMNNDIFHYHYDWRFIFDNNPKMNSAVKGSEPTMQLHRCWRTEHPWNPGLIFASYELMRRYKDAQVKNGRCPHRGAEIDRVTGQCPAHGLCFGTDGKMKFDFDKLEYRVGVDRIKCHGQSFEVEITKKGEIQDIDMVCGDEVVSRWTLPQPISFDELDTFKFFEKCGSHEIEIQTTQLIQEERFLIKMFGKDWRNHVTQ
jgi:hypothetical protein